MATITLTTDFGTRDWFVGTMKGVIAGIADAVNVVDITHDIPPQDIRAGAFTLMAACEYFPKGTIHVAVVDPGVGSSRKPIAIETDSFVFVGPDNGLLSWAIRTANCREIRALENPGLFLQDPSKTFHGRDIFAPVAAHLAKKLSFSEVGSLLDDFVRLPWPEVKTEGHRLDGEFIYFDHFGNAVTNIPAKEVMRGAQVYIPEQISFPLRGSYSSVDRGQSVALIGSHNFLELAVNNGSAKDRFGLEIGDPVFVQRG